MRERKRFEIQENIHEILERDNWRCTRPGCERRAEEVAHRIAKSKANIKWAHDFVRDRYNLDVPGESIIHHAVNLRSSCKQTGHNSWWNAGFETKKAIGIVAEIVLDFVIKDGIVVPMDILDLIEKDIIRGTM